MTRFTLDFVAAVRHRYEDTDQPLRLIFAEFKLGSNALYKMVQDGHWTLRSERMRKLPPAARLMEHVVALADAPAAQHAAAVAAAAPALATGADATALARVESFLLQQIDAAQTQNGGERTARTLSILIRALHALREARGNHPEPETSNDDDDDDDMPQDIDEFRRALARRIDEFVRSRAEPGDDRAASAPALVAKT